MDRDGRKEAAKSTCVCWDLWTTSTWPAFLLFCCNVPCRPWLEQWSLRLSLYAKGSFNSFE